MIELVDKIAESYLDKLESRVRNIDLPRDYGRSEVRAYSKLAYNETVIQLLEQIISKKTNLDEELFNAKEMLKKMEEKLFINDI